jgi:hypothetical protein
MSILTHRLRRGALAAVTAGACSLAVAVIAQARSAGNPLAVHKRHLHREAHSHRESYFGHLTGPAAAWVGGQCDRPLQSELPPCIYPTLPTSSPYYYRGWPYFSIRWRPGPTDNDR